MTEIDWKPFTLTSARYYAIGAPLLLDIEQFARKQTFRYTNERLSSIWQALLKGASVRFTGGTLADCEF
jgi:hypothetical protein